MPASTTPVHLDDHVSLAEFVALWWADETPGGGADRPGSVDGAPDAGLDGEADGELEQFLDRKQASLRMLRRNRPGFPDPVGSHTGLVRYRLGDLVSWMPEVNGDQDAALLSLAPRLAAVSPLWHVRRAVDACRTAVGADATRRLAVAATLILWDLGARPHTDGSAPRDVERLLASGDATMTRLRHHGTRLVARHPELDGVFDRLVAGLPERLPEAARLAGALADAIAGGMDGSFLIDTALHDLSGPSGLGGGSASTTDALARLLVAAGDPEEGEHVFDPAAGEGNVLLAVAVAAHGPVRLSGIEPDPSAWAVAKSRFTLRGLAVDLVLGKSLDGDTNLPTADLVVVDPPLESRRDYRRWLALAAGCVGSGGRAVIALPAVTLDTTRREWREPAAEQIAIAMKVPSRLRRDHGKALALWVIDDDPGEDVLLVDASALGRQRGSLNQVAEGEAELVHTTVHTWRRTGRLRPAPPLVTFVVPRPALGVGRPLPGTSGRHAGHLAEDRKTLSSSAEPDPLADADLFGRARRLLRGSDGGAAANDDLGSVLREAKDLAERLADLVDGRLRSYTSEEHRRALKRLAIRLAGHIDNGDGSADG